MDNKAIRKLESDLWEAADLLRQGSKLTSQQYCMPVLGLLFLRYAYSRFKKVEEEILKDRPVRNGKVMPVEASDFAEKSALFLPKQAQYSWLVNLPENIQAASLTTEQGQPMNSLGEVVNHAMELVEAQSAQLTGVLPREYTIFSDELLAELLRIFNNNALDQVGGDVIGRIYEYFLSKFAPVVASDDGVFFTPKSLVKMIVNVIEPSSGTLLDCACGSGGMFVQTGDFVNQAGMSANKAMTFFGQEKVEYNAKLCLMNMAVHGLTGVIKSGDEANTFYHDAHNLEGCCDYVMANPPFNVDKVKAEATQNAGRLPLGLPAINSAGEFGNANYLWINYFYAYLNEHGRAGFVMASSATDSQSKDIVGLIVKYAEAENVDLSALNSAQVEGIVTKFSEATGCDKSELMKEFVAYITEYKEANGVKKPTLNMQVGLSGYDMLAYRQWLKNNKVEVEGIVRLSEAYEDPTGALHDSGVKFWKDGQEIPVSAVTEDMLKPEDVAVLDKDGTMHVLITAEVTGAPEAIAEMREQVAEVDQLGMTAFGTAMTGIMPASLLDFIKSAEQRIKNAKGDLDQWYNFIYGGNEGILRTLDQSMQSDFNADRMAQLSTYVAEVVAAIKNGEEVSQEDIDNLNKILQFVQDLDSVGVGGNVTAGIAEGMTEAGWDTTAETVAENLEEAINSAFIIESPSKRMEPTGEYVAAGIGEGMAGYDFTTDATSMVTALQTAMSATLPGTLKNVGVNAMAGLKEGINAGRFSVITALRSAVQSAVAAAKAALKIASPSKVFRDEIGSMTMKGFGEGILEESKVQAKIVRNAARYLTGEAQEGAIAFGSTDNRKTYNNTSSVNLTGNNFYVRDEQDIRSLAVEIATLTRRQQRGRGLRMA